MIGRRVRDWRLGLHLVVAGVAAATYLTTLGNGFVSDAQVLIPGNARHLLSDEWFLWFTRPYFWGSGGSDMPLYRPVAVLSYAVTARLGGISGLPFMVGNVLLHATASVLVLAMGRRLLSEGAALLGALLFAVHPLHTEAVAWAAGRPDLLAAVFSLLSALCFLRATTADTRGPAVPAMLAAVAYLAALFSKEHTVTLPAWFLLAWFLGRRHRSARWTVVILVLCGAAVLAFAGLRAVGVLDPRSPASWPMRTFSTPERWLAGLAVAWKYTTLFFWPSRLTYDYTVYPVTWTTSAVPPGEALAGTLVIAGFLAAFFMALRWHRGLALSLGFMPAAYLLVSGFPFAPILSIGERFTYLPSVGACLAVGWALFTLGQSAAGTAEESGRVPRVGLLSSWWRRGWRGRLTASLVVCLLVSLGARSAIRNTDWKDEETLFAAALAVSPDSPLALGVAGTTAYVRKNYEKARGLLERSIELNPRRADPYFFLSNIYVKEEETDRVVELARSAVRHFGPRDHKLAYELVILAWDLEYVEEAEELLKTMATIDPNFVPSRMALGRLLLEAGRASESLRQFEVATRLRPGDPHGWFWRARAARALGRVEEAAAFRDRGEDIRRLGGGRFDADERDDGR